MKKSIALFGTLAALGSWSGLAMAEDMASAVSAVASTASAVTSAVADAASTVAAAAPAPVPNKGDTAWMLVSTILVILMTLPGLALFYGGLVRVKNMLSVLAQVFSIFCVIAILWVTYGYSLALPVVAVG